MTDCVSLSASSLDDAKRQASQIAAGILQNASGDARLRSDDGRVVWVGSQLSGTDFGNHKIK